MKKGCSGKRERHTIQFGEKGISFDLKYSKCKRLTIYVHPDQRVSVSAPFKKSLKDVLLRVRKKADWIIKQKQYFEQFQPLPAKRKYINGETHLYLGRQYRLKIKKDKQEGVKLIGRYLHVSTPAPGDSVKVKALVEGWYREHAIALMTRHVHQCYASIKENSMAFTKIRFRKMKTRWGSCGKSGAITLNTDLIKAPLYCIDYVIMHELCHLKYPNHGKAFYKFLGQNMPDWEQRKDRLKRVII